MSNQNKSKQSNARQGIDPSVDNTGERKALSKRPSQLSLSGVSDRSVFSRGGLDLTKISALKSSINEQYDNVMKILLTSKETSDRKNQIESALRLCKESFLEAASALTCFLEEGSLERRTDVIRSALREVLSERDNDNQLAHLRADSPRTYASAVRGEASTVRVSGGAAYEVPTTTSFDIVPDGNESIKCTSSQVTRETVCGILKPSDCALKVTRISNIRNNGIRIEAVSPNLEKIKAHQNLARAGFKIVERAKINPRLIIRGVPSHMSDEEVERGLIAQNLSGEQSDDGPKIVYRYQSKANKNFSNYIIEVTPGIQKRLLANGRIYLGYSACNFGDHIRVLQCFRCMAFGHVAKNCKSAAVCGHCSDAHEMKDCDKEGKSPCCGNCVRASRGAQSDRSHSALDTDKCPILRDKIMDRIKMINYG
ncbi:putative 50 kda protein in type i retrotransposable element r1dm [Lasius niger]|uniref:Putative 50 kDa protein in type i retrotransposable element r1dm n=1 Tax=Lasius niger TaxID=67767 RepID=A0A0J7K3C8_LASNI|nr:putative 50 kda protein in type i retrotransposable element r1dm [Lasius niger]